MPGMPSPVLIYGDYYISRNNVLAAKKKYSSSRWVTKSAANDTLNSIRMEAGIASWDDTEKIILINDLPNRKQVREFLLDLASSRPKSTKILVWDSIGHIKVNSKTKTLDKTWGNFVKEFRKISGSKVINNGSDLNEKTTGDSVGFVISRFEKYNRKIKQKDARLLIDIVGYSRGMLDSDIKKMCLIAPETITSGFILEHAFPSSKEAVQYKLANILNTGSYEQSINMMERFLESGTNANVIAEICVRKARWQMIVAYLWVSGLGWSAVSEKIMGMGRFPSFIWHDPNLSLAQKRMEAENYQSPEKMISYMKNRLGLRQRHFKKTPPVSKPKKDSAKKTIARKGSETIPMSFMADQIVDFVRDKIVTPNKVETPEQKQKLLDRAIKVYLIVQDKLAEVRYGENPVQDLQEMFKVLTNVELGYF